MKSNRYTAIPDLSTCRLTPKSSPNAAGGRRQLPRAMKQAGGLAPERCEAVPSQISLDGGRKTTPRSAQQAVHSSDGRPQASSRHVAVPTVVRKRVEWLN